MATAAVATSSTPEVRGDGARAVVANGWAGDDNGGAVAALPRATLLFQAGRVEDGLRWLLREGAGAVGVGTASWHSAVALLKKMETEERYRVGSSTVDAASSPAYAASVMTASHSILLGRPSPIPCLAVFYEVNAVLRTVMWRARGRKGLSRV